MGSFEFPDPNAKKSAKQIVIPLPPAPKHSTEFAKKINYINGLTRVPFSACSCKRGCRGLWSIQEIKENVQNLHYCKNYEQKRSILNGERTDANNNDMGNIFKGTTVCAAFYRFANQCSNNFITGLIKHKGERAPRKFRKADTKSDSIVSWFTEFSRYWDKMPDREDEVHVPFTNGIMVYKLFDSDTIRYPDLYKKCCLVYFRQVWKKFVSHVKLRKHCRFAKCDTCVDFKTQLQKSGLHKAVLKAIQ